MRRWLWLLALLPGLASAHDVLERVVIVSRHGVRAPSQSADALSQYAARPWPAWPVPPEALTPHGTADLVRMGGWIRARAAAEALLPQQGCPTPGSVFLWADSKVQRTIDSGNALLSGLAPGCGLAAAHGKPGATDPIFATLQSGACPVSDGERTAIETGLRHELSSLPTAYRQSLAALDRVTWPAPALCTGQTADCLARGVNRVSDGRDGPKVVGPLATGSMLAEDLALEYAEGFTGDRLGWGRLDVASLTQVMQLHNLYSSLTRRNAIAGAHDAALLGARIIAALGGNAALPEQHGVPAALTIFVGHDSNLDNLAALFGLDWQLHDQPDNTPPDGELVFEVWKDEAGAEKLRILLRYQTANQLRSSAALTQNAPPGETDLHPSWCGGTCTVAALVARAGESSAAQCIAAVR